MQQQPELIGHYRVHREIGRGSTSIVYQAEDMRSGEVVAIKYVRRKYYAKAAARSWRRIVKLFRAEAKVGRRLDHPNIISIIESVVDAEQAYVVMEYFSGESLEEYCGFDSMLPVERVTAIIFKCALALDHAYRRGVVHRDIKPANILINAQDEVKITDFGLAICMTPTDSTFIMGVGSPAYMSPEQVKHHPLNQKSDLYSLGVVLFHLLTGRLPFRAGNPAQLIYRILNTQPPQVSVLNPNIPAALDTVVARALQKDLYSRYRNGAELAQDLISARYSVTQRGDAASDAEELGRFERLRAQPLLRGFEDLLIWEMLRISAWLTVDAGHTIYREGDDNTRFALVLEGDVSLSISGQRVGHAGAGTLVGELAWLDRASGRQACTATAVGRTQYVEINPAALALASDELQQLLRERVGGAVAHRLTAALRVFAKERALVAQQARRGRD